MLQMVKFTCLDVLDGNSFKSSLLYSGMDLDMYVAKQSWQ